jgi:hypothetical protein
VKFSDLRATGLCAQADQLPRFPRARLGAPARRRNNDLVTTPSGFCLHASFDHDMRHRRAALLESVRRPIRSDVKHLRAASFA